MEKNRELLPLIVSTGDLLFNNYSTRDDVSIVPVPELGRSCNGYRTNTVAGNSGSCKYLSEVTNLFPFKFYQKRMIYYFSAFLQNTAWRTGEGVKCLENMNSNRSWTSSSPAPVSRRVHLTENLRDKLKW